MVYIDTILKYPSLSKEDYKNLTMEYLFGVHQNQPNVCFDDLEFIGLNYVRTNYYKEYPILWYPQGLYVGLKLPWLKTS